MQTKELIDVTLFPKKPLPSVSRDELVKLKIPLISKLEQELKRLLEEEKQH